MQSGMNQRSKLWSLTINLGTAFKGLDWQNLHLMYMERGRYLLSIKVTVGYLINYITTRKRLFIGNKTLK